MYVLSSGLGNPKEIGILTVKLLAQVELWLILFLYFIIGFLFVFYYWFSFFFKFHPFINLPDY